MRSPDEIVRRVSCCPDQCAWDETDPACERCREAITEARLDVVRRLRGMADDSILSPAELPARATLLRARDILEAEIRKAGG